MDTALDRIREKIAELEMKIADLRVTERELSMLERAPARGANARTGRKSKRAAAAKPASAAAARMTIGGAIADVLNAHGPLAVADIAEQLRAAGREIDNRSVSFALQALKKQGLVKKTNGEWGPAKGRAKSASTTKPTAKANGAKPQQTVGEAVVQVLRKSGPLPLAELAEQIRASSRDVSARTLSNTLQILKKRGEVASAEGKWTLP